MNRYSLDDASDLHDNGPKDDSLSENHSEVCEVPGRGILTLTFSIEANAIYPVLFLVAIVPGAVWAALMLLSVTVLGVVTYRQSAPSGKLLNLLVACMAMQLVGGLAAVVATGAAAISPFACSVGLYGPPAAMILVSLEVLILAVHRRGEVSQGLNGPALTGQWWALWVAFHLATTGSILRATALCTV